MPSQYLPETDHIVRIIKPGQIMWNDDKTATLGVFPAAFRLREDEENLSVSWLEHFAGAKHERLVRVRDHAEIEMKRNYGLAILNVGEVKVTCERTGAKVRMIHEPTERNPAHSAIHRYPRENDELFSLLASMAKHDLTLNRELPPKGTPP